LGRLILVTVLAGMLVPVALAADGKPQQRHTKADMARAKRASIYASDLGAGWKAQRSSGQGSNPRCSTYNPDQSDLVQTGKYDSPDFTRPNSSFVSSSTGVFRTARMAQRGYDRVAVPQLPGCFAELFRKGTGTPKAVKIISAGRLGFPKLGKRSNAYRLLLIYTTNGTKLPVAVDLVLFNRGRTDVAMIFAGIGGAYPDSFEQGLARRVYGRA
jgi:hypothetical protein